MLPPRTRLDPTHELQPAGTPLGCERHRGSMAHRCQDSGASPHRGECQDPK